MWGIRSRLVDALRAFKDSAVGTGGAEYIAQERRPVRGAAFAERSGFSATTEHVSQETGWDHAARSSAIARASSTRRRVRIRSSIVSEERMLPCQGGASLLKRS